MDIKVVFLLLIFPINNLYEIYFYIYSIKYRTYWKLDWLEHLDIYMDIFIFYFTSKYYRLYEYAGLI
jgi:hypothetical protein